MDILFAWIGKNDLDASQGKKETGLGPIGQAVQSRSFGRVVLLSNYPLQSSKRFVKWLSDKSNAKIDLKNEKLTSPINYLEIYKSASAAIENITKNKTKEVELTFHLSPGTPAMSAIWIILGSTKYPAQLIQTSKEKGVEAANVPFEISAEFIPASIKSANKQNQSFGSDQAPETATWDDIIYRSEEMEACISYAKKAALTDFNVLIEGESGTGKELFAKAIRNNSLRCNKPFIVKNCGAIPSNLIEAELFGHTKTAFTGASTARKGAFEEADGGTLFLDEIGELPLGDQVKLLRVLDSRKVTRLGENNERPINVRVIAATNKNLILEMDEKRFREDLYYRLSTVPLSLPALRNRQGDIGLLAEKLLDQINKTAEGQPGYIVKQFSPAAKNLVIGHSWAGNVRELLNTIKRVTFIADGKLITKDDMLKAIQPALNRHVSTDRILNRDVSEGIDLEKLTDDIKKHYLQRAMKHTRGNKLEAAKVLGIKNYQTLTNWLGKYKIKY